MSLIYLFFGLALADTPPDPVEETRVMMIHLLGDRLDQSDLAKSAVRGMVAHLDQVTGLRGSDVVTRSERDEELAYQQGYRDGFGLSVRFMTQVGALIESALPNGTASQAGLKKDDVIVAVNNRAFTGRSPAEMLKLLNHSEGNPIVFDIKRGDKLKRIEVYKGRYKINNIFVENSLLRFQFIGENAASDVKNALKEHGSKPLILDMRDVTGGLVEETTKIAGLFLGEKVLLGHRRDLSGNQGPIFAQGQKFFSGQKLIVLTNPGTSGMAELLVSSLRNAYQAIIIGERTAGQAAEIGYYPITEDLFLKLADSQLLDAMGQTWNSIGLKPDVMVKSAMSLPTQNGRKVDVQLQTAIQILQTSTP